jgi:hypothetical protein
VDARLGACTTQLRGEKSDFLRSGISRRSARVRGPIPSDQFFIVYVTFSVSQQRRRVYRVCSVDFPRSLGDQLASTRQGGDVQPPQPTFRPKAGSGWSLHPKVGTGGTRSQPRISPRSTPTRPSHTEPEGQQTVIACMRRGRPVAQGAPRAPSRLAPHGTTEQKGGAIGTGRKAHGGFVTLPPELLPQTSTRRQGEGEVNTRSRYFAKWHREHTAKLAR